MPSKYGNSIWVNKKNYSEIKSIIEKSKKEGRNNSVNDVIQDLLSLREIPKYIVEQLKKTTNINAQVIYKDILKYILNKRKENNNDNT